MGLGVRILTFGGWEFLRLVVSNSYVWGLDFPGFRDRNSYVHGLVLLRFGFSNSYVWGLDFLRLEGTFLTFWG